MMQIITGCTGDNCPRHNDCELYYVNLGRKSPGITFPIESWATFGCTTMWANQETGESGCEREWYCGPNGKYKMFKQYNTPLYLMTLGEIKEICSEHQKQNRDCETCKIFKFCNYEMTTGYPSGWKLDEVEDENRI